MIRYTSSLQGLKPDQLQGFFEGWPNPPGPETHLRILASSWRFCLAIDDESARVVGFVTAIGDGVLSAYLPLLEVLPELRNRGIGSELVRRILAEVGPLYMTDLVCDQGMSGFYRRFGFTPATGMVIRDYSRQSGRTDDRESE
jgi:ribosomal protein S18 acetylase RimI-like enzyme